jgi:hypothetical protein
MGNLSSLLIDFFGRVLGPTPRYKPGDSVQLANALKKELMVVQWSKIVKRSVTYSVKWHDSENHTVRTNLFRETELEPYAWPV